MVKICDQTWEEAIESQRDGQHYIKGALIGAKFIVWNSHKSLI